MAALDELYGLGFDHYQELEREVEARSRSKRSAASPRNIFRQPYVLATVQPPNRSETPND